MATDRYLISLASSCIGSFRSEPGIELQSSQSMQSAGGVHGLSAQIGALRQLLCSNGLELSDAKHIFRCAIMWPTWHRRRSRMNVHGAPSKWSFLLYSYL